MGLRTTSRSARKSAMGNVAAISLLNNAPMNVMIVEHIPTTAIQFEIAQP